ncbi:PQQ-binding-like beta-propeller repeat protein [Paludisphaera sp.]|uniref:outer membrane protein assembly factor BamB family protein n=1 Tax=Paludisphaera sp. TaxID=2017432 RepID=UPI00301E4E38
MTWSRLRRRIGAQSPSRIATVLLVACAMAAATAHAQPPPRSASRFYPDSSEAAEALLRNAANHAAAGQWGDAVSIYQRIIDQYGGKVSRLPREADADAGADAPLARRDEDFTLYVDLRAYSQRTLAALPPEALAVYRARRDAQAERWYKEGKENRDVAPLRRLVDEAFCTSWGDDALELLGDLAFQDGRFAESVSMYRRLVPDGPEGASDFAHPDPSVDMARVEAKKILALAAMGSPKGDAEAEAFAGRRGEAAGALAGRTGPLAQTLAEALKSDGLAPPPRNDDRWPTFGGSPTRDRVLDEPVDVGSMQWRAPLERIAAGRPGFAAPRGMGMGSAVPPDRLLGYHPIILGDQVVVSDGTRVLAYDLESRIDADGEDDATAIEPVWVCQVEGDDVAPRAGRPSWTTPRHTLTAVGRRIYARMGPSAPIPANFGRIAAARGRASTSVIMAIDRDQPGDKRLWTRRASELVLPDRPGEAGSPSVAFEGAPVADDRAVYVAVTDRREQTATYVACYDAADGSPRWIRYLGAASSDGDPFNFLGGGSPASDPGSRLLSLDGPALYYQTNLGAVVSLDAGTGAILWVASYPRHEPGRGIAAERDLNPAVVHDGAVFVAPGDASAIFAFDARSGRLLWKTESIPDDVKISHLLGVAKGRLVATGDRVLLFDAKDGRLERAWPDSGGREGYGRGLLAGGRIYWPTRAEIFVLDQETAALAAPPIRLAEAFHTTGGNLVAGDGYLVVAQNDGLTVFCQNSRLIEIYRERIAQKPDDATAHYRLARAAEAAGSTELALASYETAADRAKAADAVDGSPLVEAARDHEFRLLLKTAVDLRREGKGAESLARLESASKVARGAADRLRARLALADGLLEASRAAEAVDVLQELLADERTPSLAVPADDGRRAVRADLYVGDVLAGIVRDRGRAAYAAHDRRARESYEEALRARDARRLGEVARAYPAAEVVPDALLAAGAALEAEDRPAEAASAYKRLLALETPDDEARALALWRLAAAYQARGFAAPARDALLRLQARFAGVRIEPEAGAEAVDAAGLASAELSRAPLASLAAEGPRPAVPSPLARRWRWLGDGDARPLTAVGVPPAPDSARSFLAGASSITALAPDGGAEAWTAEVGTRPVWVGYLADKLVAASPTSVVGIDPRAGEVRWRFGPRVEPRPGPALDPFARQPAPRPDAAPPEAEPADLAMHGFRAVAGRLFALRGDAELVAIDGDTGLVDWSFAPRAGEVVNPRLWIGPERIVLQTGRADDSTRPGRPPEIVVLESESGRALARVPLGEREGLEREPVPLGDDHAIVVTDSRTVKKLDLERGRFDWEFRESEALPPGGPPRAYVDAERLLVLHDGRTLIRLDPATGSRRWSASLGTAALAERPQATAMDESRFYWASERLLRAVALEDGSQAWRALLAGPGLARWSIALSDRSVVACPEAAGLEDDDGPLPVVVRRRDDGALVQRLALPTPIDEVALRIDPRGATVATPHALWSLGAP